MNAELLGAFVPRILASRGTAGPGHWVREGTLVFADVSGFTRLTEKLSRAGKIGAEEIVRAISSVFTALLTATTDGGDVLKFSGDALLLFYDGNDHQHRACHAALTLQRTLQRVGGIDSPRGRVRLRMSVGVHSGQFHFFCCGGDHLELFVLGADASTTVAMEAAASAGEVLISTATAAALGRAGIGAARAGGVRLRSIPAPPAVAVPEPAPTQDLERFVAPPLRDRLGDDDHEHRRATVAFVGFGGMDALLRADGPGAAFERVQALTTAAMASVEREAVLLTATDIGVDGGTFMLTAGAPDATGDDEVRMLRAVRQIVEADAGLPVRAGVHAGDVFVGAVGATFRRTYSTMGAATNLAARMMGQAAWGQVLATAAVTDHAHGRFALQRVPPFTVRGHSQPVAAAVVRGPAKAVLSATDDSVPLVGRDGELQTMLAALARAASGAGEVVEIVGGIGMGKSRLVAEVRTHAEDWDWLAVFCDPYERTSPYHSARLLLRQMLGIAPGAGAQEAGETLHRLVDTVAPQLRVWVPLIAVPAGAAVATTPEADAIGPRYRRGHTQQVTCDLVAALPAQPCVVAIEDADAMDDASAELIAALLARVVPSKPWLAIVTRQAATTGLHAGRGYRAHTLPVPPLDPAASAALAARMAERTPVPAHLLPQLVERAGGSPLFLAELVAAQATAPGEGEELPRTVEAIIAARIDRLAPADRRALRALSVLGDRFADDMVDLVLAPLGVTSAQQERWDRLDRFIARTTGGFEFRNALTRQVAYEGLTYRQRRELHGRVADALAASGGHAPLLPLHLTRAQRWEAAWTAAINAADDARDGGANAVAGQLYDMALLAARHLGLPDRDVAQVAWRAGEVWERAGLFEAALRAYGRAASTTASAEDRLMLTLHRARVHENAGRYSQALRLCRRVLTQARSLADPRRCLAWAHIGYASARLAQGRAAQCVTHARNALDVIDADEGEGERQRAGGRGPDGEGERQRAGGRGPDGEGERQRAGDRGYQEALARTYHLLDRAYAALGDHQRAARYRDRALPVFATLGDLAAQGTVLYDLGADAQRAGRPDEALWLYERSHEVRMRAGNVVRAAESANAIGEVLLAMDRCAHARERFAEALRMWRGARVAEGVAMASRNLGIVALREGDAAEACRRLEEAAELAAGNGLDALHVGIHLPLATALLRQGRFVEAWDAASRVLDGSPEVTAADAANAHELRAEALLATGGTRRAQVELERARHLTGATDATRTSW